MLAHHPAAHQPGLRVGAAVGDQGRVGGLVEGWADVVTHAAVDADVEARCPFPQLDALEAGDGVEGDRRRSGDCAAGLDGDGGDLVSKTLAGLAHGLGQGAGDLRRAGRHRVGPGVGDAVATAQVDLRAQVPGVDGDLVAQGEDDADGLPEAGQVQDLGADVGVQPVQLELGGGDDRVDGLPGSASVDGEAELLVLVAGGDVLVATGVHAGGQAHHDLAGLLGPVDATGAQLAHGADSELNLLERVEDEVTHVVGEGDGDLGLRLAVTVQAQTGGVRGGLLTVHLLQGGQGHGELAAAGGVDAHALLEDPLGDLGGQEGLPGVEGLSPGHAVAGPELLMHGSGPGGGATAQVGLIQDEDGAGGLGEDLGDGQPAQDELAVVRAPCRGGPQVGTVLGLGAGQ